MSEERKIYYCYSLAGPRNYFLDWRGLYYMANSESFAVIGYLSGQDSVILPAWELPVVCRKKWKVFFFHIIIPLLIKLVQSRWLNIGLDLFNFCVIVDVDFGPVHKHREKQLGQYLAILNTRSVNNPHILGVKSRYTGKYWEVQTLLLTGHVSFLYSIYYCLLERFSFECRKRIGLH